MLITDGQIGMPCKPVPGWLAERGRKKKELYDMKWRTAKSANALKPQGTEKHRQGVEREKKYDTRWSNDA